MSEESYDGSDAERIDAIESDSFRAGLDEADEKIIIWGIIPFTPLMFERRTLDDLRIVSL